MTLTLFHQEVGLTFSPLKHAQALVIASTDRIQWKWQCLSRLEHKIIATSTVLLDPSYWGNSKYSVLQILSHPMERTWNPQPTASTKWRDMYMSHSGKGPLNPCQVFRWLELLPTEGCNCMTDLSENCLFDPIPNIWPRELGEIMYQCCRLVH